MVTKNKIKDWEEALASDLIDRAKKDGVVADAADRNTKLIEIMATRREEEKGKGPNDRLGWKFTTKWTDRTRDAFFGHVERMWNGKAPAAPAAASSKEDAPPEPPAPPPAGSEWIEIALSVKIRDSIQASPKRVFEALIDHTKQKTLGAKITEFVECGNRILDLKVSYACDLMKLYGCILEHPWIHEAYTKPAVCFGKEVALQAR